jgi:hypothetical protein
MKRSFVRVLTVCVLTCWGVAGCNRNTTPPAITFGSGETESTVASGEAKELTVQVKADAKLKEVKYYRRVGDGEEIPYGVPVTKFSKPKKYECLVTLRDIVSDFVLVVEATDKKGRVTKSEFSVKVNSSAKPFVQEKLYMGFNMINTIGSSYSVNRREVLLLNDAKTAQEEVDFMFFFGKENGITVAAPSDEVVTRVFNNRNYGTQTWGTRSETRFVKVNLDFNGASREDIASAIGAGSTTMVNHLQEGDTVAFQTASGQIGLLKIFNVGPNSASTFNLNVRVP